MTNEEAIKTLEEMKARMVPLGPLLEGKNKDKEAVELAISALEKQIPKIVKMPNACLVCPTCGRRLAGWEECCCWCGQKLRGDADEV